MNNEIKAINVVNMTAKFSRRYKGDGVFVWMQSYAENGSPDKLGWHVKHTMINKGYIYIGDTVESVIKWIDANNKNF